MKIEIINGVTILTPEENKWLTNGNVYSDKVLLGKFDSIENWTEVTEKPEGEEERK